MQMKGAKEPWIKGNPENRMSAAKLEREAGGEGIKADQMAEESVGGKRAKVFKGLAEPRLGLGLQGGPEHGCPPAGSADNPPIRDSLTA